jgi:hypothetical protein
MPTWLTLGRKQIAAAALGLAMIPAGVSSAQSSAATGDLETKQLQLIQQANALKAQMHRAQIEQAADKNFAAQAYAAQQAYLMDTAEKSFRMEPPRTLPATTATTAYGNSPHQTVYQVKPAMPPVHVSPSAFSVAPVARTAANLPSPQPAYPTAQTLPAPQPATSSPELPAPHSVGYDGESYDGRGNNIGLQDRISGLLHKAKSGINTGMRSKSPTLAQTHRQPPEQLAAQSPQPKVAAASRTGTPTLATRAPNPAINTPTELTKIQTLAPRRQANSQNTERAAFDRIATAINSREADFAVSHSTDLENDDIAQVALVEPSTADQEFIAPRAIKREVPAKQISILSNLQEDDNDFLRKPEPDVNPLRNELEKEEAGNLRLPEQDTDQTFEDEMELRLRKLEQEDTESELEEKKLDEEASEAKRRRNRSDLDGELRKGLGDDDDLDDDFRTRPTRRTCAEARHDLLNRSISEISLDLSPRASRIRDQYVAISRSWTDRLGNVIATGTMVDLRRGYVIIDSMNGREKIPYAKLSDADWNAVSEYWQIPELCSVGDNRLPSRQWIPQTFTWKASALCHKPLYFENRQLERYGHTHGPFLQPIQSTGHFFTSLFTLPYQTAIHPPTECMYALGYYRPGNCAPWLKDPVPISLDGIRRQALVTTGIALLP